MMNFHDRQERREARREARDSRSGIAIPKLIFGLLLILIGIAYTLDHLGYVEAKNLIRFWPALLIAAGIGKLLEPGSSSSRFSGLLLFGIGALFLGDNFDILHFDFESLFPLVLVAIGLRLVWLGLWPSSRYAVAAEGVSTVDGMVLLGGGRRTNNSADFRGGDLMAVMGGFNVDLRSARIATSPAVIDVFAFWGGIDIRVPEDWDVTVRGIPLLGGFEDKTQRSPSASTPEGPRQELIVKGFAIMGGIEIKN